MYPETDLLRKAREGDSAAAEQLYTTYLKESRPVAGLLRRTLSNPDDREELLHDIYLQLISGTNTFRGEAKLSTYVYQVARITIFQKFRRENTLKRGKIYRTVSEPMELADGIKSSPEFTYSLKEAREVLESAVSRLPEAYRDAIRLRLMEELTYDEIAVRLKLPLNTVSTKIHKGKRILSNLLKERGFVEVFDF